MLRRVRGARMFNKVVECLQLNWNDSPASGTNTISDRVQERECRNRSIIVIPLIALILSLAPLGRGCAHEGSDHRLLGHPRPSGARLNIRAINGITMMERFLHSRSCTRSEMV